MSSLLFLLRTSIFFLAGYALLRINPLLGLILFAGGFFTFLFKLRSPFLLSPSPRAQAWELWGTALVLFHTVILLFVDYTGPYSWVDIPMHVAGGAFAAFWARLAFHHEGASWPFAKYALTILGITALVGIGWEFFEWTVDHSLGFWYDLPKAQASIDDTMGDFFLDLLGGVLVIISLSRTKK